MEQQFLEGAVNPWGRLITLADSDIGLASASRAAIWLTIVMACGAILACALGIITASVLLPTLAYLGAAAWMWIGKGRARVTPENLPTKLSKLQKARSLFAAGLSGSVWICPKDSDLWRSVIKALAPLVNAVVLSVPENTPQLEWELTTLRSVLGPSKLIVIKSASVPVPAAFAGLDLISVPKRVSWWTDYRVSYFGQSWGRAMRSVLRAIESDRVEDAAQPRGQDSSTGY